MQQLLLAKKVLTFKSSNDYWGKEKRLWVPAAWGEGKEPKMKNQPGEHDRISTRGEERMKTR